MSLLDTLKTVKDSGFKAGDRINTSTGLETGIYPVRIKQATHTERGGRENCSVAFEVVSGKHKDRLEFLDLSFGDDLPEFVQEKNAKILLTLIDIVKKDPTKSQLEDIDGLVEYFQSVIGTQLKMDLRLSPNKKNPQYPYRNYEFSALEADNTNVSEDDFPF